MVKDESGNTIQLRFSPSDNIGFEHIAFEVSDVESVIKTLRGSGVTIAMEPGIQQSKSKVAFIKDPDGNSIELIQRL